jgi:hypothetical protein
VQNSTVCMAERGLTGTQGLLDKKGLTFFLHQDLELWGGDFYTDEMDSLLSTIGLQLNRSINNRCTY